MAFQAAIGFKNLSAFAHISEYALNRYIAYTSIRQLRGRSRVIDEMADIENDEQFDEEIDFTKHSKAMKKQINSTPRKPEMGSESRQSMESEQFYDTRGNTRSPFWNERAKQFADNSFEKYGRNNNNNSYNNNRNDSPYNRNKRFNERDKEFDTKLDSDFDDNEEQQNFNTPYNRNNNQFRDFNNRRYNNNNNYNNRYQGNNDRQPNQFRQNYDNRQNQNFDGNRDNRNQFQRFNNYQRNQFQSYDNRPSNQYQRFNVRNNNRFQDNFEGKSYVSKSREMDKNYSDFSYRKEINNFDDQNDEELMTKSSRFDFEDNKPRFSRLRGKPMQTRDQPLDEENVEDYDKDVLAEDEALDDVPETRQSVEQTETPDKKVKELIPIPYNVTLENRFEVLNQMLCPLHIKPYRQQLNIKYRKNLRILQFLGNRLRQIQSSVVVDNNGLPCPLELVKPSPITDKYRNNDEYSIWPGVDGNSKTVGYFIGQPSKHNNVVCVEPDHIIVSKDSHKSLAKKFQNYLRDVSPYDTCKNFDEGGNWRRFHIRSNEDGEHMLTAIMHPQQLSSEEIEAEIDRIRQYFDGDERVKSLYFQASLNTRSSNEVAPFRLVSGDKQLLRKLFDKKFLVSPDTFFQVNTSAAQVLYNCMLNEVNANKKTTVLDLCCGAGVFSSLVAPYANRVIGIDTNQSAINDAKQNIEINGIKNVNFIAGHVEEELPKLLDELYAEEIVIVANPSRSGLRPSAINALRQIKFAHKLVYMSCHPEGTALRNFVHLSAKYSKNRNEDIGVPFVPTNAVPVDLFPHTDMCELIVTFERF